MVHAAHEATSGAARRFERVVVLHNPNSTGDGPGNAHRLRAQLGVRLPGTPVELRGTRHPGHAEELAERAVTEHPATLVVSASGDARAVQHRPLPDAIVAGAVSDMDLLQVRVPGREPRCAHSYVGLGITPVAAAEFNRHDLDALTEGLLALRTSCRCRPPAITHDGERIELGSPVFANIDRMAECAVLSRGSSPADGTCETLLMRHRGKLALLAGIVEVLRGRHESVRRCEPYAFTASTPVPLQMDGEVHHVDAGAQALVSCAAGALSVVR
ncbi:diacylglycerol/lipid kinase family protein [Kineococcus indalonis]|uniref:diacylglycerol/lipid kinase family protein n=1 Tax=Kineococcus indalonis TaxID=2696566 RepID=UPI0014120E6B|nr:diacylglycerol kinase [Kineococcus indalonis]NAZ86857.1 diacylglycerol kinase [Kineococcus indalonis]